MSKTRILSSYWDEEEKYAELTRATPYGIFTSYAKADDEDYDDASSWDGFKICEARIKIQVLKCRIKEMNARLRGMKMMYHNIVQSFSYQEDWESEVTRKMERQIEALNRELQKTKSLYETMTDTENFEKWCISLVKTRKTIREHYDELIS